MYKDSVENEKKYIKLIENLKTLNRELKALNGNRSSIIDKFKCLNFINFFRIVDYFYSKKENDKKRIELCNMININKKSNYFSDKRIAVYTCLFGKYDKIYEPVIKPNNIDYYILTDNDIPENSLWKKIDFTFLDKYNYSNIEKNRYVKMNPHLFFENYEYSIYVDANIKIIGDFTELINRMGNQFIGFHLHQNQFCIYDQIKSCIISNKDNKKSLIIHRKHLLENHMPKQNGMVEANVIVRRHNNKKCIKLMADWWNEFINYSNRDQISLHYVLWKNGIEIKDIAVLGNNVRENDSLYVMKHGGNK